MKKRTAVLLLCIFIGAGSACQEAAGFNESFQEKYINDRGFEYITGPWNSTKEDVVKRIGLPETYFDAGETKDNGTIVHYYANPSSNSGTEKNLKAVPIHIQDLDWKVDHIGFLFQNNQLKAISLMKEYTTWEEMKTELESVKNSVLKLSFPEGTEELINPEWQQKPLESLSPQYVQDEGIVEFLYRAPDGTYLVLRFWNQGSGETAQRFIQLSICGDRDVLISRLYLGKGKNRDYIQ